MKKFFMFLAVIGLIAVSAHYASAQEAEEVATEAVAADASALSVQNDTPIYQAIKTKFIEGGPGFMATVVLCLIFGLALSIERIIYLNLATTNTNKLLASVEEALKNGGVEAAKEVCRTTKGPVASIFYQGLDRMDQGVEMVEKSVVSYGGVQMGLLESGLSWIHLNCSFTRILGNSYRYDWRFRCY